MTGRRGVRIPRWHLLPQDIREAITAAAASVVAIVAVVAIGLIAGWPVA